MSEGDQTIKQQRAVLLILLATCQRALEAFEAAENIQDEEFIEDLERIIARTRRELDALAPSGNA
ncbi:MAG TPA: hypothetical protein VM290_10090 [Gaiellaceae bacterium]|nr:hypothetical protein [Gaiellaceae bacterium]